MQDTERNAAYDEKLRLQALDRYHILDTEPEPQFDDLVRLAADICEVPMALITLVDRDRQWFKARVGIDLPQTARNIAFCEHVVQQEEMLVVSDARTDPRFSDNPLVRGDPHIRFYAGAPLRTSDGFVLGSLAVLDRVPRSLTPLQERTLPVLAREVVAQLELRRNLSQMQMLLAERERAQAQLRRSHRDLEGKVRARTAELQAASLTLRKQGEQTAHEAAFSQALIDSLPGIVYVVDENRRFVRWNRNIEVLCACSPDDMGERRLEDLCSTQAERNRLRDSFEQALAAGSIMMEIELRGCDGQAVPYYLTGARINVDGRALVCGMGIDITERRKTEESLRLLDRAVQASVDAIIITDLAGRIEFANPAFERITGYSAQEVKGRNCRFLQDDDRVQAGIVALREAVRNRTECEVLLRNYRKNGELFWNDVHIAPVRSPDGTVTHYIGVLNDVTALKYYERELERHANVDPLTALASRSKLQQALARAISVAGRIGNMLTVGFIDLDNFKFINESLGHRVGDDLLKRVAGRLLAALDADDIVARYGGDEFVIVLVGCENEHEVAARVEAILRRIDQPFQLDGHRLHVSCSIGLSLYPRDGTDVDTLLMNAAAAVHLAKEQGRNNFQFYTPAMNRRVTERLALESRLRQALENGEFALHYQPKLDLRSGAVSGAEALLRWYSPGARGMTVSPATFIPLAEETGLINAIGEWVLNTACAHNKALQDMGLPPMRIAVNISARQFEPRTIVALLQQALAQSGLDARYLELELTESMVMRNPEEASEVLHELKAMGVRLAIDDFGTGYSSLSQLQRFPVDLLKIDQSFVRDIGADPNHAVIARAVISLGHSLGMNVIAEGVSNREQMTFLHENGCDEIQGYLFSRPLAFEEFVRFMREQVTVQ